MKAALKLFLPIAIISLFLVACSGTTPPLAEANKATLVYIFTDG